mmetsp:Transcript_28429/g.91770  ORF Transcript_28429/g.91770 Transcript_28429/m.91770 type:complete len:211 (+) Transcript_28429:198-830(+)
MGARALRRGNRSCLRLQARAWRPPCGSRPGRCPPSAAGAATGGCTGRLRRPCARCESMRLSLPIRRSGTPSGWRAFSNGAGGGGAAGAPTAAGRRAGLCRERRRDRKRCCAMRTSRRNTRTRGIPPGVSARRGSLSQGRPPLPSAAQCVRRCATPGYQPRGRPARLPHALHSPHAACRGCRRVCNSRPRALCSPPVAAARPCPHAASSCA